MSVPADQMSQTPQPADPSQGNAPTWDQIEALLQPPPADPAAVNAAISSQPTPPDLSAVGAAASSSSSPALSQYDNDAAAATAADQSALSTYQAQSAASQADIDKLTDAEVATLQEAPPAPPTPTANPLQRMAPLLLLSAFGGKATKLSAGNMLAATSGVVQGYLSGNQQAMDTAQKQYQEAYAQFKDRQEQQLKIYDTLKEAYQGRADADLKAWQMAHEMTGDELKMDQQRLSIQDHMQTAAQTLAKNQYDMDEQNWQARANLKLKADAAKKKAAAASQSAPDDRGQQIGTALAAAGVSLPTGTRSAAARAQVLNGLAAKYPNMTPDQIAQQVRAGQISMKVDQTEAGQVARREGNIAPAVTALTEPDGLFDQLDAAARKIDFGSDKVVNNLRLAAQGKAVSDPDIQRYVTLIQDVQTDVTSVLSRTGQATDAVRRQAMDAFPLQSSYAELKTEIDASRKVARALQAGNQSVIAALTNGSSIREAGSADTGSQRRGTVSSSTLTQYAKQHKITTDQAKSFLAAQGYTVQ